VLKSKKKMILWSHDKKIKSYKVAIGIRSVGPKRYKGDLRTPEGCYVIESKNPHSMWYKNLGISYPDESDRKYARLHKFNPGGQVKIHGLSKRISWLEKLHSRRNWTAGCIAVSNSELDEIYANVRIGTPIEIKP